MAAARVKPERFADYHRQSRLFWKSKTLAEELLIFSAFRFGLIRMLIPAHTFSLATVDTPSWISYFSS